MDTLHTRSIAAMPRLANGPQFDLDQLIGRQLDALVGVTETGSDDFIEMLFIHLAGDERKRRLTRGYAFRLFHQELIT